MDQWRDRAGWGFLAIIGVVLIVVGFLGRPGSLLAVFLAPDQMIAPDDAPPPDKNPSSGGDQSAA